ncbi:riboflavin synthase [soil metagenome]
MFTGLVETTGEITGLSQGGMSRLVVRAAPVSNGVSIGDSVSVNGVCLTVNRLEGEEIVFYVMPETLRRTALGELVDGDPVNLERAMSPTSRFGGHIVQGHVDGVGEVLEVREESGAYIWEFGAPESVLRYTVEKGSVCVDGISLTVVSVDVASFTVSILPQTRAETNIKALGEGDRVNLEADVIGKYVERLLEPRIDNIVNKFERSVEDAV